MAARHLAAVEPTGLDVELAQLVYGRHPLCPTCAHRAQRILARETQVRRSRRRMVGRLLLAALFIVLGALAYTRFGHDPMASVQR